jgi:hypothetical protein
MARTQAVHYRDKRGAEPVNNFVERLPAKRAAKIDEFVGCVPLDTALRRRLGSAEPGGVGEIPGARRRDPKEDPG